ncbi:unnamed protein product [Closterium sp. NIES-65]|nr:unnamed protein product [Closterium sp. NIES-65]
MAAAKWLCFVCCMWILSTAGTSGTFAIYSPVLKAVAGYDQKHIQALAVAKDVGESVGLVAGILCDWLPGWLMLLVGALHYLTGFGGLWLVASQRIQPLPFWQMCSLILVGAQGTAWFNTAALVTCIRNSPRSRGPVVGVLKGLVGLSNAILSQAYSAFLAPNQPSFLLVLAVVPLAVAVPTMSFVRGLDEAVHRQLNRRRSSQILLAVGEGAVRTRRKGPRRGEDFTLVEALRKADFWLLVFSYICGCGSGLTAINNLAQMASSQGYSRVQLFVSLVSVWNFIGRLAGGYCSEHLVKTYLLPRPLLLLVAQLVMSAGHAIYAIAFPYSLHIGSLIVGLCYGVHWSVMPATVSELFGLKNFGLIFNAVAAATPIGSYLFSSLIAGYLYDYEAHKGNGVSTAILKKICRENGIPKWPFRKHPPPPGMHAPSTHPSHPSHAPSPALASSLPSLTPLLPGAGMQVPVGVSPYALRTPAAALPSTAAAAAPVAASAASAFSQPVLASQ